MDLSKIEAAAFTSPTEFWSVVIVITALSAWIFHQRTTRWRVTPKGFHGVPSGVKKNSMEKDFVARTKAHMLDFRKGTDFVMDGYEKVCR